VTVPTIIGIDPGPVVGVALLALGRNNRGDGSICPWRITERHALQVTPGLLGTVLDALGPSAHAVAVERFVVGPRAARSSTAKAGGAARDIVGQVTDWADRYALNLCLRSAAEVKPWATDERLIAAGLLDLTTGMRHARDATRHALFCAVRTYGLPDPLSKRGIDR